MKKELIGWLGGNYDDLGFYDDREDAERGMMPNDTLDELLEEFKGEKVRITIEKITE